MSAEWVPGTIDPRNGLLRTDLVGAWAPVRELTPEELEEGKRDFLERIAKDMNSQAFADFITRMYKLNPPIDISKKK